MNDEENKPPLVPYYPGGVHIPPRDQQKPLLKMLSKMLPQRKAPKGKGVSKSQTVKLGHKKGKQVFY